MLVANPSLIINPTPSDYIALGNAIASTGCTVTFNVIYVQWQNFSRRRNLQQNDI